MALVIGHTLLVALVLTAAKPASTSTAASAPKWNGPGLSYLKSGEGEVCEWMRQPLPSGEPVRVFSFDATCGAASVAWSRDGKQGLVTASNSGSEPGLRVWRVDLQKGTGTPVSLSGLPEPKPPTGKDVPMISDLSFDPQGRLVALVHYSLVLQSPDTGPDGKRYISFEGKRYPVKEGPGNAAILMAYRLQAGTWKRVELKATSSGDFTELKTARTLQPVASQTAMLGRRGKELQPKDPAWKLLAAAFPDKQVGQGAGRWMRLTTPGGPLYYLDEPAGDGYEAFAPVRWGAGGKLTPVEGVPDGQDVSVNFHLEGPLLLVQLEGSMDPKTLIIDTKTKKPLLSLDDLTAPVIWPRPSRR
jgi:hypothetical protein